MTRTVEPKALGQVEGIIRRSLRRGHITDITPIVGEGVADSELFGFQWEHRDNRQKLVVKTGEHIGCKERLGRKRLADHLPLPIPVGRVQPDAFIYRFIPGASVNRLVRNQNDSAGTHLRRFAEMNTAMWRGTLRRSAAGDLEGYPQKLETTQQMVMSYTLGGPPLSAFADHSVVVNGHSIPCLTACLAKCCSLLQQPTDGALQHGDEGASNDIVHEDDTQHFFIDNGVAGFRPLAEGVTKLIMWWPVTAASPQFEFEEGENRLVFNYQLHLPDYIREPVTAMATSVLNEFAPHLEPRQLAACVGLYCLRELQWIMRRGVELNPGTLLAMAFDAFAGMFSGNFHLPGIAWE